MAKETIRLAALGDLHYAKSSQGALIDLFTEISNSADVFLMCGDLTDYGLPEEAHILAKDLNSSVKIPIIAVLGNHDFESGQPEEVKNILCEAGIKMLDGDACEVRGIGFAGAKGFAGGFGRGALGAWGEPAIKMFVQEAMNEAMKLENGLARLRTPQKIAVLHYSPIQKTVEGEPVDIFPFLGSSRLEDPLLRYPVSAVFHGHAHHGTPEGRTTNDIPVFNVALPLMRQTFRGRPTFRLLEIPIAEPAKQAVS